MYLDEGEADGARAVFLCDSPLGPRPLSQGHVQESVGPAGFPQACTWLRSFAGVGICRLFLNAVLPPLKLVVSHPGDLMHLWPQRGAQPSLAATSFCTCVLQA